MNKFARLAITSALMMGFAATPGFFAQEASATIVVKMDIDETVKSSDCVVKGTVIAKEGKMVDVGNGNTAPMTFYTVKVSHEYVGQADPTVIITNPGGVEKDGLSYNIPSGFPDHQVGEDVILMLDETEGALEKRYTVTGLHQGKFFIAKSSDTGKVYVTRTNSSAQLVDAVTKQPASAMTRQQYFELDEFETVVAKAAEKAGKNFKSEKSADDAEKAGDEE